MRGSVGVGCLLLLGGCTEAEPAGSAPTVVAGWAEIAPSPLGPRAAVASTWTGSELLIVGGADWTCPVDSSGASCVGPSGAQMRTDAAAYAPATNSWRILPAAPQTTTHALGSWTGAEMVVLVPGLNGPESDSVQKPATLALDPANRSWRALKPPPSATLVGGTWTGTHLIYWQSEHSVGQHDWMLDPASGSWSALPADPFVQDVDRAYGWTGEQLILAAVEHTADRSDAEYFQLATLDLDTRRWSHPIGSPVGFWSQQWFMFDDAFVNPSQNVTVPFSAPEHTLPVSGAYDVDRELWVEVPQTINSHHDVSSGCHLPSIGPAGTWLAAGGSVLVSLTPPATTIAPDCSPLAAPAAAAWTGQEVLIWGGHADTPTTTTDVGLTWTPPHP